MKTLRIKSNVYSKKTIQFGMFVMNFNEDGIAEVDVKNNVVEANLNQVVNEYSDFIQFLEDADNALLEAEKLKDINYLKKVIDEKDEKITILEKANNELASENANLKAQIKAYKEIKADAPAAPAAPENSNTPTQEENNEGGESETEENENGGENQEGAVKISDEEGITEAELNKKTIPELQTLLKEVFGDYEDEWKALKKKGDIIFYIINKVK